MKTVFIECGTAMTSRFNTGIQRVVRNIVRESRIVASSLGIRCLPVNFEGSEFHRMDDTKFPLPVYKSKFTKLLFYIDTFLMRRNVCNIYYPIRKKLQPFYRKYIGSRARQYYAGGSGLFKMLKDDSNQTFTEKQNLNIETPVLLLLDSTWDMGIWPAVDEFRAAGGFVCAVLYDLIPFSNPETVAEHTRDAHTKWWLEAPKHIDSVICISKTVRLEFLKWQEEYKVEQKVPPHLAGYFYLGSELTAAGDDDQQLPKIFSSYDPYFLVVGSIEPRKNHCVILDAFEMLWQEGHAVNLVMVGGTGWKMKEFVQRVKNHPMYNKRLFLLRSITDAELVLLYNQTAALIIASINEGFGLPIVEAFQCGAKVICSDIPVFHEIAGDNALYFDSQSPLELLRVIKSLHGVYAAECSFNRLRKKIDWLTWRDSASQILTRVIFMSTADPKEQTEGSCE